MMPIIIRKFCTVIPGSGKTATLQSNFGNITILPGVLDSDLPRIRSSGRTNCIKLPGINQGIPNPPLFQSLSCKISSHSLGHSV